MIIGPVGIVIADSLYGEVSPAMAVAVGQSGAQKMLLPVNQCSSYVAGVPDLTFGSLVSDIIAQLKKWIETQ